MANLTAWDRLTIVRNKKPSYDKGLYSVDFLMTIMRCTETVITAMIKQLPAALQP